MPPTNKLSDLSIRNSPPRDGAYKLSDGGGLYLLVHPNGSRYWRLAYRYEGKQKLLALGVYPQVSLALARAGRDKAKQILLNGGDPGQVRQQEKQEEKGLQDHFFRLVALSWVENYGSRWSVDHRDRVRQSFEADVFPFLGDIRVDEITPPQVLQVVRSIESRGALDVAYRVIQRTSAVFRYAIQSGLATVNPAAEMRGVLKTRKVTHRAAISAVELPGLLHEVNNYSGDQVTRLAIQMVILTFVRTAELRGARWSEFDFSGQEWSIPAERMKMKAPHRVPLSRQALTVLDALRPLTGHHDLLFPSRLDASKPFSENTMLFALYRLGYHGRATTHGFRALASTVLNESGFRPDVIERQLAHIERNKVRAAYHRSEYLEDRRKMMDWWGDYLESAGMIIATL